MARGYPDFEGDKSGLYPITDWSAKEGVDKVVGAFATDKAFGAGASGLATPTSGKAYYIRGMSGYNRANLAVDADNNQMCVMLIIYEALIIGPFGGNGGGFVAFDPPLVIVDGTVVTYRITNYANHNTNLGLAIWGYEK